MKLVIGLGNPGEEYKLTRHNIGFMFLDYLNIGDFSLNKKLNAMECIVNMYGEKVIYVKPLSYMNLSGEVVKKYINFYKFSLEDIVIIQDDLDLPVGKFKLLYNHGAGGHNGIKNIINELDSKEFLRIKVGISKNMLYDTKDYVLGKFSNDELKEINNVFDKLKYFVRDFCDENRNELIQKYNTNIKG